MEEVWESHTCTHSLGKQQGPWGLRGGSQPLSKALCFTHSTSDQQESHSPRPLPSVPPGEEAEDHFLAPLFAPLSRITAAVQLVSSSLLSSSLDCSLISL